MAKTKGNMYDFQWLYTKDHKFVKQLNTPEQLYSFSKVNQLPTFSDDEFVLKAIEGFAPILLLRFGKSTQHEKSRQWEARTPQRRPNAAKNK